MKYLLLAALIAIITGLGLHIFEKRILIYQKTVEPGEYFFVPKHENLGDNDKPSLFCKYFDGRETSHMVYWHSNNNVNGKKFCPIILDKIFN